MTIINMRMITTVVVVVVGRRVIRPAPWVRMGHTDHPTALAPMAALVLVVLVTALLPSGPMDHMVAVAAVDLQDPLALVDRTVPLRHLVGHRDPVPLQDLQVLVVLTVPLRRPVARPGLATLVVLVDQMVEPLAPAQHLLVLTSHLVPLGVLVQLAALDLVVLGEVLAQVVLQALLALAVLPPTATRSMETTRRSTRRDLLTLRDMPVRLLLCNSLVPLCVCKCSTNCLPTSFPPLRSLFFLLSSSMMCPYGYLYSSSTFPPFSQTVSVHSFSP